jgi:hypothetical protein
MIGVLTDNYDPARIASTTHGFRYRRRIAGRLQSNICSPPVSQLMYPLNLLSILVLQEVQSGMCSYLERGPQSSRWSADT